MAPQSLLMIPAGPGMPGPDNVYPRSHESHEYLSRGLVKCLVWPQSSDDTNTPVGHNIPSICDVRIIGK